MLKTGKHSICSFDFFQKVILFGVLPMARHRCNISTEGAVLPGPEMETGRVDGHRSRRPAGRVAGLVEILRPAGQAG